MHINGIPSDVSGKMLHNVLFNLCSSITIKFLCFSMVKTFKYWFLSSEMISFCCTQYPCSVVTNYNFLLLCNLTAVPNDQYLLFHDFPLGPQIFFIISTASLTSTMHQFYMSMRSHSICLSLVSLTYFI